MQAEADAEAKRVQAVVRVLRCIHVALSLIQPTPLAALPPAPLPNRRNNPMWLDHMPRWSFCAQPLLYFHFSP